MVALGSSCFSRSTLLTPFWKLITAAFFGACRPISLAASQVAVLLTQSRTMSAPASALALVANLTSSGRNSIRPLWPSVRVSPFSAIWARVLSRPIRVTSRPDAAQAPPIQQPSEPAPWTAMRGPSGSGLSSPAIGSDALVGHPQACWRRARLPEDVDRNAAARIPIAADPQPHGLHLGRE